MKKVSLTTVVIMCYLFFMLGGVVGAIESGNAFMTWLCVVAATLGCLLALRKVLAMDDRQSSKSYYQERGNR